MNATDDTPNTESDQLCRTNRRFGSSRKKLLLAILTAALISTISTGVYWLSQRQLGNIAQTGTMTFLSALTMTLTVMTFAANDRR